MTAVSSSALGLTEQGWSAGAQWHLTLEAPGDGVARQCFRSLGRGSHPAPLTRCELLPGITPKCQPLFLLVGKAPLSCLPSRFFQNGFTVPLHHAPPLTGLRGKWRVLYILADCSPFAPVSLGWGWGDGGVSKLYIELLTGAEALWFPWQPGWK